MSYSIEITIRALGEIEDTYRWIANNREQGLAQSWYQDLNKAIQSLTNFPNRCPIVSAAEGLEGIVRQLKFGSHLIYFEVAVEIVRVFSVQHVRQEPFPND